MTLGIFSCTYWPFTWCLLPIFKDWVFVLLLNCKNSFYHLAYKVCCEYFLPVCGVLFYFVKGVLQRVCKFDEVLIIYQVFHSLFIFFVCSRDLCQFPGHKEFSPIFFFWKFYSFSFWNLGLWFKLIFVYVVRYESRFISLPVDTQLFQHHLLKSFLSPLNYLGAFVKNQLPICEWAYLWAL